tara:strand:- start:210 stop:356 length:147 start_codon:yes stop_codon:yes gene_type:complete
MTKFENSIILMGIDWSKAAKLAAVKDISKNKPGLHGVIRHLDYLYRKR